MRSSPAMTDMQAAVSTQLCVAPTPGDIALVRDSFSSIEPALPLVAELFFQRLYELEPDLKGTFPGAPAENRDAVKSLLILSVTSLDRLEEIYPSMRLLAAKGRDLHIGPYYYGAFGEALLWTLENTLQDRFTPEVRDAWTSVYASIAEVMTEGA